MNSLTPSLINIITLGCAKNIVDSEYAISQLTANGFSVTHNKYSFNKEIVIINTCGFIGPAKQESIDTILQFAKARKKGLISHLYVMGCLTERYKKELKKEIPEVDQFFGVNSIKQILRELGGKYKKEMLGERGLTTPAHYAYLKISEGCNRKCSFCAIPLIRGEHKSLPLEQCVKEAVSLSKKGVKEIILVAQDLTYYGADLYGKRMLPDLLKRLSDIQGIEWIRLHYSYPLGFPLEVIKIMKERLNICNYIDIPLQHISSKVLKRMKRGMSSERTKELISYIRSEIPDAAIRTTFITGFPGETEDDFEQLKEFIVDTGFERMGVFPYSHEEDTYAGECYADNVPEKVKQERAGILMQLQRGISLKNNEKLIGAAIKTLIDRREGKFLYGRTEYDSPDIDNEVIIANDKSIIPGNFYNIKITKAEPYDLWGRV